MAGEVQLRATLARPFLAAGSTPQVAYVLLEIQPTEMMAQVRMPINVSFVLDHSGSMKGEKIDFVRQATSTALALLDPKQDIVSVVIFDHRTELLIPSTSNYAIQDLQAKISRIRDAGGTKIAPAIEEALKAIQKGNPNHIRRLLLLTDGQTEQESKCLLQADEAGKLGVPITALGVGDDWNEDLLIEMANRAGGTADFISRPDQIVDYFQNTVQRAQAVVIQKAQLLLRLVKGVTLRTAWQVIPLIENLNFAAAEREVSVNLGELEKGQSRTLLLELLVEPRAVGQYRVGQLDVTYAVPTLNLSDQKVSTDVILTFTVDGAQINQVSPSVMNIVEKVSAFKLQTRALQEIQEGKIESATQKLKSVATRLLDQGETDLAQTIQLEIANLEKGGQLSSEGQKTMKFAARKTVRLSDLDAPQS